MSRAYAFSLSLIVSAILSFTVDAAELSDISQKRDERIAKNFVGTYISHDQIGRQKIASVWLDNHGLHMWEIQGYPVFVTHTMSFSRPLQNQVHEKIVYGTGVRRIGGPGKRKKYFIQTEYEVINQRELLFRQTETDADGLHKSVEERRMIFDGTSLHVVFERIFFKKKYVLFGDWIKDTSRDIVRRNTISLVTTLVKQSEYPLEFEAMQDIARRLDVELDRLYGNPQTIVADFGWEGFTEIEEIINAALPESLPNPNGAEILKFPRDCNKILKD